MTKQAEPGGTAYVEPWPPLLFQCLRRASHNERFPKPVTSDSQGYQHDNTLFIPGQRPMAPSTNAVVSDGDISLESRQVMRTIEAGLQESFPNAQAYPCRAVVQAATLVH